MLGKGAAGAVYKAKQKGVDRIVALKILDRSASATDLQRFQRECQTLSKLDHVSIVHIYAWGATAEGTPYLALEYVNGLSLQKILQQRGKLPVDECLAVAVQVCDALSYAHAMEIVHRDIKPANIAIAEDGTAKLLDFGLAKFTGADVKVTSTEAIVGTPIYMAPEQFMSKDITGRSDVYALACSLYEALTGSIAFPGETAFEIFNAHASGEFAALPKELPQNLRDAVEVAMRADPALRFSSAEDFKKALLGSREIVVPQMVARPKKASKPLPLVPIALVVLAVFAVCGGWIYFNQSTREQDPGYAAKAAAIESTSPAMALELYAKDANYKTERFGPNSQQAVDSLTKLARAQMYPPGEKWRPTWQQIQRIFDARGKDSNGYRTPEAEVSALNEEIHAANRIFYGESFQAADLRIRLANALRVLHRHDQAFTTAFAALHAFEEGVKHGNTDNKGLAQSHWVLATLYDDKDDFAKAETNYLDAIHYWLAFRFHDNMTPSAEVLAINLEPLLQQRVMLADLYYRHQRFDDAIEALRPIYENNEGGILWEFAGKRRADELLALCTDAKKKH